MKKQWLLILGMLPLIVCAQKKDTLTLIDGPDYEETELNIYPSAILSQQPVFPGGSLAMKKWCLKHTYFDWNRAKSGIKGKVYCEAIIDTLGRIYNLKIVRPTGNKTNFWLEKETMRLISSMPPFEPGKYGNKVVNVKYLFSFLYKQDTIKKGTYIPDYTKSRI